MRKSTKKSKGRLGKPTPKQVNYWIISTLRRHFAWSDVWLEVMIENVRIEWIKTKSRKAKSDLRKRVYHQCANCLRWFSQGHINVDHISPVIPVSVKTQLGDDGYLDIANYVDALYCERSNLQKLCKSCHKAKSKAENSQRRGVKDEPVARETPDKKRRKRKTSPTGSD
jgi:5-methylcytosine-specific restriction endonuclease McrA